MTHLSQCVVLYLTILAYMHACILSATFQWQAYRCSCLGFVVPTKGVAEYDPMLDNVSTVTWARSRNRTARGTLKDKTCTQRRNM